MYDIFLVGKKNKTFDDLKKRFILAKQVDTFDQAQSSSLTEFCWIVWDDILIDNTFEFSYEPDEWSKEFIHVFLNDELYNGVCLVPKTAKVSSYEIQTRFFKNKKEVPLLASVPREYDQFTIDSWNDYQYALENSETDMFWMTSKNISIQDSLLKKSKSFERDVNHAFIHKVNDADYYNGVYLLSKSNILSQKEIEHRHIVNRKEWDIVASGPKQYDQFTIDSYDEYLSALASSTTEMFWANSRNIDTSDFDFNIYFTHNNEYDRKQNHAFIHQVNGIDYYNGVFLFSKHTPVSQKEIEHRHIVNRKEWDIVASGPVKYDIFIVDNWEEYQFALESSTTELFWATSRNITADIPDIYFTHDNGYDRNINHAFIHQVNGIDYYNGVFLFSKHTPVSQKEIEHRHIVDRKEWDIVASGPKQYDQFTVDSYNEYLLALESSTTELFWATSRNITADIPDIYFTHDNGYDRTANHAFIHRVDGIDYYNGVFLFSKHTPISQKEIDNRFIVNRKEWDIVASGPKKYDQFIIDSYDEYLSALESSTTELFWATSRNITADIPDLYFTHNNEYDRKQNHAFIHRVDGIDYYNGLFLFSKHTPISQKEIEHRHIVDRKEWDIVASGPKKYDQFIIDSYDEYLSALESSTTELFWATSRNITAAIPDIYFTHNNEYDRKQNHAFIHQVDDENLYNGVFLFSKYAPVSQKEIEHRHIVDRKEWDIVASGPVKYNIFIIDNWEEYQFALKSSTTELFWATSRNITADIPDLYFTHNNEYDRNINHAFIHQVDDENLYNGVFLFSKHSPVSQKEIEHRHIVDRKEWDIVASGPKQYDQFIIDSYDEYLLALESSTTELFWATSRNITADIPNIYFTHDNGYDRTANHAFIHSVDGIDYYNGVFLFSKHTPVSQKEIDNRFIVNVKEWDIVASGPKQYDQFTIDSYDEYLSALESSTTELFWATSRNIEIDSSFNFDIYFTHNNEYDRKINHAFIHYVDEEKLYNGVMLLSKHVPLSQKEIEFRYLVNKKEWDIVASGPKKYDQFTIDSYDEYLSALESSNTEMFWVIPNYVDVLPDFKFDVYFSHDQDYNRKINHAFLNGKYHDGIWLCSKFDTISKKEFDYRFTINKKEVRKVISKPKPYDVVFISYQEPNADENYKKLLQKIPSAHRIHGIKGIHQAHIAAANLCNTDMFWIVDGDAVILDDFNFDYQVARWDREMVHVWRSQNPINNLVYGYGGVKLFPTNLTLNMDVTKLDMTTSISSKFYPVQEVSNITKFNTDPFNTWKSAFRECVKLSSKVIDRQKDKETQYRLSAWCTIGEHRPFGEFAIEGAKYGTEFGTVNKGNMEKLKLINDFEWLKEQFNASQK